MTMTNVGPLLLAASLWAGAPPPADTAGPAPPEAGPAAVAPSTYPPGAPRAGEEAPAAAAGGTVRCVLSVDPAVPRYTRSGMEGPVPTYAADEPVYVTCRTVNEGPGPAVVNLSGRDAPDLAFRVVREKWGPTGRTRWGSMIPTPGGDPLEPKPRALAPGERLPPVRVQVDRAFDLTLPGTYRISVFHRGAGDRSAPPGGVDGRRPRPGDRRDLAEGVRRPAEGG